MTNQKQSKVFVLLVIMLASVLLDVVDSASTSATGTPSFSVSTTSSFSISISNSYSTSLSNSYSTSISNSVSYSTSISTSNSISNSFSNSNSYSNSISYSNSYSYSTSYSPSNFFTTSQSGTLSQGLPPNCDIPTLSDRCGPQVTVVCLFYANSYRCPPPPKTNRTFDLVINRGDGAQMTIQRTAPPGELPQFPTDTMSTNRFVYQGQSYVFQVFPVTGGIRGPGSNLIAKTLPLDDRDPTARCREGFACNQNCFLVGTNTVTCSYTLGNNPLVRLKVVILRIVQCFNAFGVVPVPQEDPNRPRKYFFKSDRFKPPTSASILIPSSAACFVKLTLRYPPKLRSSFRHKVNFDTLFVIRSS